MAINGLVVSITAQKGKHFLAVLQEMGLKREHDRDGIGVLKVAINE